MASFGALEKNFLSWLSVGASRLVDAHHSCNAEAFFELRDRLETAGAQLEDRGRRRKRYRLDARTNVSIAPTFGFIVAIPRRHDHIIGRRLAQCHECGECSDATEEELCDRSVC